MLRASRTRRSHKVLVTGATGFIGSHVVKVLQEQGHQVRGTTRNLQNEDKVKPLYSLCPGSKYKLELVEADLLNPESWDAAVKGMEYVIHVASPFPLTPPDDEDEVIKPAVEGTLNVLKACNKAKTIKRIVLTSSIVAMLYVDTPDCEIRTEQCWSDPSKLASYEKSKTLAEKAAWEYVKELPVGEKMELAVINPGAVLGPVIHKSVSASQKIVKMLLERSIPSLPCLNHAVVDVRDVAVAHVNAMIIPEAAGNRHILATENVWFEEMALILEKEFGPQGYNIPTKVTPYFSLWVRSICDEKARRILPRLGKVYKFDNSRMKNVLGIKPHCTEETLIDMAYSMIEGGFVFKTDQYIGPSCK